MKSKKSGLDTIFTKKEEQLLIKWCENRQKIAYCVSLTILKGKVKQICSDRLYLF